MEEENRKQKEAAHKDLARVLVEVKDRVESLQEALTCPDPVLEAAIQNRYSWSRCGFQLIYTSTSES